MEIHPDFDAAEVARTVALAVSNLHTRPQSSDSSNDETPLVKRKGKSEMNPNSENESSDNKRLILKETTLKCWQKIPARHVLTILGFFGFCNVYALRVNLSVALVTMVNNTAINASASESLECPASEDYNHDKKLQGGEFIWSPKVQGDILGAFFYGYLITQIPGGRLAEKFGGKWLFGIGVLITSILTLLTPIAARWGVPYLIALRVLEGLGEGVTFPAMHSMLGRWLPKLERSVLTTIIYSGSQVGTVIALPISGLLCESEFFGGWPSVFYVFGFLGCLWFIFWAIFVHEAPELHPRISKDELLLIQEGKDEPCKRSKDIPWKDILTSVPVWTLMLTHFGQNWGFYTFLTELPTYLSTILHFRIRDFGFLSALPYLLQAIVSWCVSYVADLFRQRQYFTISTIRKIFNSIAFFGPALCLVGVILAACDHIWSVFFLTLAMGFNGCTYSGFMVTHVDMSPDFAGTLMGMTNAFATLTGFLAPKAVGALTEGQQTLGQWKIVFFIAILVYLATGLLFIVFGSAQLQKWGAPDRKSSDSIKSAHKESDMEENAIE